jgi:hypothetical protein
MGMETRCRDEVIALHQFFEGWFSGRLPKSEVAFERCRRALAPGFRLLSPDAMIAEREALLAGLFQAHGTQVNTRIWIEDFAYRPVVERDGLGLVTYQEWQERAGVITCRLSSALMAANAHDPDESSGVVWLHLHETWVRAPEAGALADTARPAPEDLLLARFEAGALSLAELDHQMHVELAWRYLRSYPMLEALERFIDALRRFAVAHGKAGLYHETITWAYMLLIQERAAHAGEHSWPEFMAHNPDLLAHGKRVLERYYRADTLRSEFARAHFVFPDRGSTSENNNE